MNQMSRAVCDRKNTAVVRWIDYLH